MSEALVVQDKINAQDSGHFIITDRQIAGMSLEDVVELQAALQRLVFANPDHDVSVEGSLFGINIKWRKRNVEQEA